MNHAKKTLDFGCPNEIDPHHFVVHIPESRIGDVVITEHFGLLGGTDGRPEREERAVIARDHWRPIADSVKRVFNERLKAHKLAASRWKSGDNKIERLLGKELCILAWGIEQAEPELVPVALTNWLGFKPEERWWLYSMTAASAGRVDDGERGWRKALSCILLDHEPIDGLADKSRARFRGDEKQLPFPADFH